MKRSFEGASRTPTQLKGLTDRRYGHLTAVTRNEGNEI
jgi:hypothetical protein